MTGGNRGIGRAIAEAFLANGDQVAVTTRSGGAPDGALDVRCDITDPEQVDAAFAQVEAAHGPVEVLVANAGITADTLLLRMSDDDWSSVIDTNLTGSFRLAKRASKGMLRLKRGRIVFISSVVGLTGSAGQVNYAASKAGLVGVARSIARAQGARRRGGALLVVGGSARGAHTRRDDQEVRAAGLQRDLAHPGRLQRARHHPVHAAVERLADPPLHQLGRGEAVAHLD